MNDASFEPRMTMATDLIHRIDKQDHDGELAMVK